MHIDDSVKLVPVSALQFDYGKSFTEIEFENVRINQI